MQFSLFIPAIGGAIYSGAWSLEDGAPDNFWPMRSSMRFVLGALSTVGMTIVFERIRSTWRKWRKAGRDMESFETQVTQATQDLKLESMSRGYD
ncbi:hypothetical protein BJ875DRAFT_60608 [Amylocarpus encephaloides]|uniref:Uncharacterized protein n=1 Tax=Amylocarpus encephaloides TaxID=45428 RepID=A0A9P7YG97_9HELO|nr:hypothetical protein BJ875DRAFT_60608 [Amylocarpus encephaloides]